MLKIKIIYIDSTKWKKGSVLNRRKRGEDGAWKSEKEIIQKVFEKLKHEEYVYFHASPRSKQHKTCGNEIKNSKGIREFSQRQSDEIYSMHH